ncbi:MAG: hypothetical protein K0R02_976 [Rickettsiaceae bacterium]|jgi:hypothetical protein|nr:hypothetical protein [Rickettsiaceae bacterium]
MKKRSYSSERDNKKTSKAFKAYQPSSKNITPLLYSIDKCNKELVKTFLISCDPVNIDDVVYLSSSKHDDKILEKLTSFFHAQIFADSLFMKNKLIGDGQKNFNQEAKELIILRVSANLTLMTKESQQKFATNLEDTFNNNLIENELFDNIKKISTIAPYFEEKESHKVITNNSFQVEGSLEIIKDLFSPLIGDIEDIHYNH